jgi:hypothetical protein
MMDWSSLHGGGTAPPWEFCLRAFATTQGRAQKVQFIGVGAAASTNSWLKALSLPQL